MRKGTRVLFGWLLSGLLAACGGGTSAEMGEEGGACYGNGTCNGALVCLSDVCVDPTSPDGGGGGGGADGGGGGADGGGVVPGTWVRIEAGTFTMGSPEGELGRFAGETQHEVTLTRAFQLMTTEVTQGQYEAVMGYAPSYFSACGDDCPVENVTWYEAAAYANALSERAGYASCYDCTGSGTGVECARAATHASPYHCPGYRLPTEAEWEYAARAGDARATYNGELNATDCTDTTLGPIAWFCGNSEEATHPVATKQANAWGLYDMLGNVWEWTADAHAEYPSGAVADPWVAEGSLRVGRGGSWYFSAADARAANRANRGPGYSNVNLGFRLTRSLP